MLRGDRIGLPRGLILAEKARIDLAEFADRLLDVSRQVSAALPPDTRDRETLAIVLQATLIGTLQLARAVQGTALSDRILAAGADAARALVRSSKDQNER